MDKGLSVSRIDVCCNNVSLICLFVCLVGWLVGFWSSRAPSYITEDLGTLRLPYY